MTPETERLFRFLDLESRVLTAASVTEVAFVVVNETHALVPYRQAMLWSPDAKVEAVSGLATPDPNAPFVLWLNRVFPKLAALHATPAEVDSSAFPEWAEWLPAHGFYVPLGAAGWLLTRDEAWSPPEQVLLGRLAEAVAAARRGFVTKPLFRLPGIKGLRNHLKIVAAVFLVLIFPVTGSVLAPAEMVAARPSVVRAPLDGAIAVIHVQPNDPVAQGQPLFDLDQTTLVG